jgi:hypothetical protein
MSLATTDRITGTNGDGNGENSLAPANPKAIVVEDRGEFANLLDTNRFGQLWRVASLFSRSMLVPEHYQGKTEECFIATHMSMRMGIDPLMFMQNTYIVHGRPGMEAKLAIALINSSGLFADPLDYEIEGNEPHAPAYRVRAFATRKTTGSKICGPWVDWKLVRAEGWDKPRKTKSGYEMPSKWTTMPGLMFQYRAAMFFGRLNCPERLLGMQTVDELEDVGGTRTVESTVVGPTSDLNAALNSLPTPEPTPAPAPKPEPTQADRKETARKIIEQVQQKPAPAVEQPAPEANNPVEDKPVEPDQKERFAVWMEEVGQVAAQAGMSPDEFNRGFQQYIVEQGLALAPWTISDDGKRMVARAVEGRTGFWRETPGSKANGKRR